MSSNGAHRKKVILILGLWFLPILTPRKEGLSSSAKALYERLKARSDVQLLTLNYDEEIGLVVPFMKQNGVTFPVLFGQSYVDQVQPDMGIPQNWIVDAEGTVRTIRLGISTKEEFVDGAQSLLEKYSKKH